MLRKIGSLWKPKDGSQTKSVLSGSLDFLGEEIRVVILKNDHKEKASHPDYSILRVLEDADENPDKPKAARPKADEAPF